MRLTKIVFMKPYVMDVWALLAGVCLTFAFAPWQIAFCAIIAPAVLLLTWMSASAKRSTWRGLLFGLGFFGSSVSWVYISIHTFGETPVTLAIFITALFLLILSLYTALQGYLFNRFFPRGRYKTYLLGFPALWVIIEALRGWLFSGFPWLFIGYSQLATPLKGFAPIFGIYGVSFIVVFTAASCVLLLKHMIDKPYRLVLGVLLIWGMGAILNTITWTTISEDKLSVALVQGNIAQSLKWDPEQFEQTLKTYQDLTAKQWDKDLIVWPEAAIPMPYRYVKDYLEQLEANAKQHNSTVVLGLPFVADQNGQTTAYNGVLAVGNGQGRYYKERLVPFGEYLPLEHWLRGLINFFDLPMSDFKAGPKLQAPMHAGSLILAPYICYEIIYPDLVLGDFPLANVLITINDDTWFGRSIAGAQHLAMAQMRAIETGRYLLFVSNDGPTAIVDPHGNIIAKAPRYQRTVLTGEIASVTGATPLMWWGNKAIILILLLLLLSSVRRKRLQR